MNYNFIIVTLILNIIFIFSFNKITKKFNFYDFPDYARKIHKKKTSLIGGFLFFIFNLIYLVFYIFDAVEIFFTLREMVSLIFVSNIFFIIGLYDDKFNLKANTKIYLMIFVSLCIILINNNFLIEELNFSFYSKSIILGNFSILFTTICFICFVNACNMFDGIDLQFGFYLIFLSTIFISKGIMIYFYFGLIICGVFFLYYNFNKKIFIGNNGTLLLGTLFSFLFIGSYTKSNLFFVDEIFLIMAIPGFDLIRVSILRLTQGKNMFQPDSNHIHHLLIKKISIVKTNLLIQLSIVLPFLNFYIYQNFLTSIIIATLGYLMLFFYAKSST